ncbi:UDP-N-acetylmuramate dehydrogenase [Senimuribacter intestinalis]|uniref:UDP-N-acetylmuramate dehydrogenase n=1 Tax=Senimuribacter intestinalis TaxID=2941507 RepID=UPI00203C3802|nr:UDP-N-acetylmuramate dehydrogenase [Senimuribacter intestinalis]
MERLKNIEMKEYTSFKAGGKAAELIIVESVDELRQVLAEIDREQKPYLILGNGSNTLVKDSGFAGTVVKLGENFNQVKVHGETGEKLVCGCGALMSSVAKFALAESLTGFEFASGIPGSIGGAVFMNAGAYGGEMKDIVESVNLVSRDGRILRTVSGAEMDFSYRHSILQETGEVAVSVVLRLSKGDSAEISDTMRELTRRRNEKQPVQYPSAGSFFKRPEGFFAGKLIQDAGLKGISVGGAQVSELHSGFIVNKGGATATDIIDLMHLVQNTVFDQFGVQLEPEVRIIGD